MADLSNGIEDAHAAAAVQPASALCHPSSRFCLHAHTVGFAVWFANTVTVVTTHIETPDAVITANDTVASSSLSAATIGGVCARWHLLARAGARATV